MLNISNENYKVQETGDILLESLTTGKVLASGQGQLSYKTVDGIHKVIVEGILMKTEDEDTILAPTKEEYRVSVRHVVYTESGEKPKVTHDLYVNSNNATVEVKKYYDEDMLKVEITLDESIDGQFDIVQFVSVARDEELVEEELGYSFS